jgi:NADH dehydrogenase
VIGTGEHRLQPIWGEDVGAVLREGGRPASANRTFELGGPDAVTWNELYERIAKALGKRRARVNIPTAVVRPAAALVERLPRPPITRDQVTMLEAGDSTCDIGPALETFRLELLSLDEQLRRVV